MTGQLTKVLPQENESQKIGRMATKCFNANIPTAWKAQSLDGDDDCGYDFQIQTVDSGEVKDVFRAQLKGKTAPSLNAEREHCNFSITNRYFIEIFTLYGFLTAKLNADY